jgi:hypothetical protein
MATTPRPHPDSPDDGLYLADVVSDPKRVRKELDGLHDGEARGDTAWIPHDEVVARLAKRGIRPSTDL